MIERAGERTAEALDLAGRKAGVATPDSRQPSESRVRFISISEAVRESYRTPCTVCGDRFLMRAWRGRWLDWICARCDAFYREMF